MSLTPIPHQPVDLVGHPEVRNCASCPAEPEPCTLIGNADRLYLQMRNEPDWGGLPTRACDPQLPPTWQSNFCGEVWVPDPLLDDPGSWSLESTYPGTNPIAINSGQLVLTSSAAGYNQWKASPNPGQVYAATASEQFTWTIRTGSQVAPDLLVVLGGSGPVLLDGTLVPGGLLPNSTYSGTVTIAPFTGSTGTEWYFNIFDQSPTAGFVSYLEELYFDRVGNGAGIYGGRWRHTNLDGCYAYTTVTGGNDVLTLSITPGGDRNLFVTIELAAVISGGVSLQIGTQTSPLYTTSGTHTWTVYLDLLNVYSQLEVVADPSFIGQVRSVQLQKVLSDIDTGGAWYVDPVTCAFRHSTDPANTTPLVFNTLLVPGLYAVEIRVDDMTTGSVTLGTLPANPYGLTITRAGLYTSEVYLSGVSPLAIFPTVDFDGLVSFERIGTINRNHGFYVLDAGGAIVTEIDSAQVQYEGNFVSVIIEPADHVAAGDCFTIGATAAGRCGPGKGEKLQDTDLDQLSCGVASPWTLTSVSGLNFVDPLTGCWDFPYGSGVKVYEGTGSLEQTMTSPPVQGYIYCLCVTVGPAQGSFLLPDLLTNGTFTGSSSPWVLSGNVSYNAGAQRIDWITPTTFNELSQTVSGLVAGQTYQLTFTINLTPGPNAQVLIVLGGNSYAGNFTTSGTYTVQIVAGNTGSDLLFSLYGAGSIDTVSLKDSTQSNATLYNPPTIDVYLGALLLGTIDPMGDPLYGNPGSTCLEFLVTPTIYAAGTQLKLEWSAGAGQGFAIDYVSLTYRPRFNGDLDFQSNCIAHTNACDTAYLSAGVAVGLNDWANDPYYQDPITLQRFLPVAYGFQFSEYFQLAQRARVFFTKPKWDGKDDYYPYRNGYNLRHSGDLEHVWDLIVADFGVSQHDALAIMSKCQYLRIDGKPYLVTQDDYVPNYPAQQIGGAADVSLEVREVKNARKFLRRIY